MRFQGLWGSLQASTRLGYSAASSKDAALAAVCWPSSLPSCDASALCLLLPARLLHPSSSSSCLYVLPLLVCFRRAQGMRSPVHTSRWCLTTRTEGSRCAGLRKGKGWQDGGEGDRGAVKGWDKGPGQSWCWCSHDRGG